MEESKILASGPPTHPPSALSSNSDKSEPIEVTPSQLQQALSELFRINLCRNDDFNLIQSSFAKRRTSAANATFNKSKLLQDLQARDEDRCLREKALLKQLKYLNKGSMPVQVEKHCRKMARKILLLAEGGEESGLVEGQGSHVHLAQVMGERTQREREVVGEVDLVERGLAERTGDEKINAVIDIYLQELKQPYELITRCIDHSRDRFLRELSKLEAIHDRSKFFTDAGVAERKEKVKFKVLLSQAYGSGSQAKEESKQGPKQQQQQSGELPLSERAFIMLQIHNSKVKKIVEGHRQRVEQREKAKQMGVTLEQLREKMESGLVGEEAKKKKKKLGGRKLKSKRSLEVVIKVKGEDGNLLQFEDEEEEEEEEEEMPIKNKKKKTVGKQHSDMIKSEHTLKMIKKALKNQDQNVLKSSDRLIEEEPKKKKPAVKKGTKKPAAKKPMDTETRFFNDYSESPVLQQIEDSYLKLLQAQYAKESHLKQIKKFQILRALKRIQRFWRGKYTQILHQKAGKIQLAFRRYCKEMRMRVERLKEMRKRLLLMKLKRELKLYVKMWRVGKGKVWGELDRYEEGKVLKMQAMVRMKIGYRMLASRRLIQKYYFQQRHFSHHKCRQHVSKQLREKETFMVSRVSLGKAEVEQIGKYLSRAEDKFESNWSSYETQLEKYLTKNKEFKDWVQKKDEFDNVFWINIKTLKQCKEHPGIKVFQMNKKILKTKAEEELRESFKPIVERKVDVLETLMGIRHKVYRDLQAVRVREVVCKS